MRPMRILLTTTSAVFCLGLPAVALAQTQPEPAPAGQHKAAPPAHPARGEAPRVKSYQRRGPAGTGVNPPPAPTARPSEPKGAPAPAGRFKRPYTPGAATQPAYRRPPAGVVPARPQYGQRPPAAGVNRLSPALGGWNRSLKGREQERAGAVWREQHRNWDHRTPWRRDQNWWRHDRRFQRYLGPRVGFFFMPYYGYITVPFAYQSRYWQAGQYLPQWYWRFIVQDYLAYGLPPPPPGCAWVWVNRDIALVDLDDGYILDITHNIW